MSVRMSVILLGVLLLLHLPNTLVSALLKDSAACGTYHVSYLSTHGQDLFYINGNLVGKSQFCSELKLYYAKHCIATGIFRSQVCGWDVSSDEFSLVAGRKLLQAVVNEGDGKHELDEKGPVARDKDAHSAQLSPRKLALAIPATFILCCSLLCRCFRTRRKESEHAVLAKEPVSMDSISSLEMNSVHEKIPGSPLRVPPSPSRFSMSPKLSRIGSVHLSMRQVSRATQNFSPSLVLGEGGFGTVYKAQLQDGQVVAIKRAKKEHFEALQTEFKSEVELLTKIEHRNLVKLLGYTDNGDERLIITEYVPNGTLRDHLDGNRGKSLDFSQRLEISIDIAHALTYLHLYAEKQIIHRDVKSSNILLTETMRAKVADFGFARLGEIESDKTHVSTKVKGTVGYLDPEYMKTYQLTPKSDVYSFGILLIEILTGRRPLELKRPPEERVTLRWAFKKYNEGNVLELVDPSMKGPFDGEILIKMFGLAIQCAAPTRVDRPDMKSVGEQLWVIRMEYLRSGRRE